MANRKVSPSLLEQRLKQLNLRDDDNLAMASPSTAKGTLGRWLSVRSVIPTASSNAIQQQEAASSTSMQVFRSVGKGFCGEIFEKIGTARVYKRELNSMDGRLCDDYKWHTSIYDAVVGDEFNFPSAEAENPPKTPRA